MAHTAALAAIGFIRRLHAEPLTVADVADHVGYSPAHFSRAFARITALSPGQYLAAVRFEAAKHLLLTDDRSVSDICAAVGFDSLPTFTRRFAGSVGTTPAALRHLAESVGEHPPRPFERIDPLRPRIRVRLVLPAEDWSGADLWVGWYPRPAPVGLPGGGVLVRDREVIDLPMSPGNPWLFAFAVAVGAPMQDHFALGRPVAAAHPAPIVTPPPGQRPPGAEITLNLRPAPQTSSPLLSALPVLWEQKRRNG